MAAPRSGESGQMLLTVALSLVGIVLVLAFVVDIANFFVHKRHLQTQADAAALAGAGAVDPYTCDGGLVATAAQNYSGDVFNAQIGDTPASRMHFVLNAANFFDQGSPGDADIPDPDPCVSKMVDVKMTETDAPFLIAALDPVRFINAHARAEVRQIDQSNGLLPVGVEDPSPRAAKVQLLTEDGTVLAQQTLHQGDTTTVGGQRLRWYDNSIPNGGAPLHLNVADERIRVRVILSGSTSLTCGDPLVVCYDDVNFIRGWTPPGTVTATSPAVAQDVTLTPGSCVDAYFTPTGICSAGVSADVAFNTSVAAADKGKQNVWATYGNNFKSDLKLTWQPPSGTTPGRYVATSGVPVAADAGPVPVGLRWEQTTGTLDSKTCTDKKPCAGAVVDGSGNALTVQRSFGGSRTRSGPLERVIVSEAGVTGTNSVQRCTGGATTCQHDFVVSIAIDDTLSSAIVDPATNPKPLAIRVTGSQSNGQTLDCDPFGSPPPDLESELANGCQTYYRKNTGQTCPGSVNGLEAMGSPYPCVLVQTTGGTANKVARGMNQRVLGSPTPTTCTSPNRWPDYVAGERIAADDPRVVPIFLTPFGTFDVNGNTSVPVLDLSFFYVTGWQGQGGSAPNPCQAPGQGDDPAPSGGWIVGHFVKYIETVSHGATGSERCDFAAVGGCVVMLTR